MFMYWQPTFFVKESSNESIKYEAKIKNHKVLQEKAESSINTPQFPFWFILTYLEKRR